MFNQTMQSTLWKHHVQQKAHIKSQVKTRTHYFITIKSMKTEEPWRIKTHISVLILNKRFSLEQPPAFEV